MEELKKSLQATRLMQYRQNFLSEDILASYLQPLLKNSFLPFSNFSMRPASLACILNDVLINRRKHVLEFGAGISTILLGCLAARHKIDTTITSIEHDKDWIIFVRYFLDREKPYPFVEIIYAPLTDSHNFTCGTKWYDVTAMNLDKNIKFDLVIINGPPAWEFQKIEARYAAFPFIKERLSENSIVYLDDAEREGEQRIPKKWEQEFNVTFSVTGKTLAFYDQGKGFNPQIGKY